MLYVLGKTYEVSKNICAKSNASYGIFGNGLHIVDLKSGKDIYKNLLSINTILGLLKYAKENNLHTHIYTEKEIISEHLMYMDLRNSLLKISDTSNTYNINLKIVPDLYKYIKEQNVEVFKIIISAEKSLESVKTHIHSLNEVEILHIQKYGTSKDLLIDKEYEYLDISPKYINKDYAVKFLSNYLNISNDEIMAIGDNLNDIEMIKNVGLGVAVANAYSDVKNVADFITTNSVEENAFAEAIYKFIPYK